MDDRYSEDLSASLRAASRALFGTGSYGELLLDPRNFSAFTRAVEAALEGWVPAWELDASTEGSRAFHMSNVLSMRQDMQGRHGLMLRCDAFLRK